jgi:hypothetical protein
MASRTPTLTNTIYIRDFVDCVTTNSSGFEHNHIEIQSDINVVQDHRLHSDNIIVESIPTRIRAYVTPSERESYVANSFFYAEGRFGTTTSSDDKLEITVHTFNLMR